MAYAKVSTTRGTTNSKRRAPRAEVKRAAAKRRRAESHRAAQA